LRLTVAVVVVVVVVVVAIGAVVALVVLAEEVVGVPLVTGHDFVVVVVDEVVGLLVIVLDVDLVVVPWGWWGFEVRKLNEVWVDELSVNQAFPSPKVICSVELPGDVGLFVFFEVKDSWQGQM
jgi:hypothetical protein